MPKLKKQKPRKVRLVSTPPPIRKSYDWLAIALTARKHAPEWIVLPNDAPAIKSRDVFLGYLSAFQPAGAFDAVQRDRVTYIQFVGEPVDPLWMNAPDGYSNRRSLERHPLDYHSIPQAALLRADDEESQP